MGLKTANGTEYLSTDVTRPIIAWLRHPESYQRYAILSKWYVGNYAALAGDYLRT